MVQIITPDSLIEGDFIKSWINRIDIVNGQRSLIISIDTGSSSLIEKYAAFKGVAPDNYPQAKSLTAEAIYYSLAEAKESTGYCYIADIFALALETFPYLAKNKNENPKSFDAVVHEILTSFSDSRITIPSIDRQLNRIEAYLALKEMRPNAPLEITIANRFLKETQRTIIYTPSENGGV